MICAKCNHKLPVDSEFCQYCGCKLDNNTAVLVSESIKPTLAEENLTLSGDMSPKEAMDTIMKIQAKNTVEAMQANRQSQPDDESDPAFGLIPEKPIFTHALKSVDGQRAYLDRLRTPDGQKLRYERQCSMSVDGINGMIDVYDTFLPSGEPYKTLFINMYGAKTSSKAPVGFAFQSTMQPRPTSTVVTPAKPDSTKTRYCSRCGSAINGQTKVCSGCGKQYFKGFHFTKSSVAIIVLSFALAASLFVLVHMISAVNTLDRYRDRLNSQINEMQVEISNLEDEVWFFHNMAEIVPSNGTEIYHKWGCSRLDLSDGYWIFNTEYAEWLEYYKCPYCH